MQKDHDIFLNMSYWPENSGSKFFTIFGGGWKYLMLLYKKLHGVKSPKEKTFPVYKGDSTQQKQFI